MRVPDLETLKKNAEELQRWVDIHGGVAPAARAAGVSREWMRYYCEKLGVRSPLKPGQTRRAVEPRRDDGHRHGALLSALRKGVTRLQLADLLDMAPRRVDEILEELRQEGYPVEERGGLLVLDVTPAPAETVTAYRGMVGEKVRFGIVSDTHLGSREQQLTYLRDAYKRFADLEITEVYHIGDLLAGVGVYRGQHAEIFLHTEDEQVDYAEAMYPHIPGIKTRVVGGNHDLVFLKHGGADPLRILANRRDDIEYLGPYSAWVEITPRFRVHLLHPTGGQAYSISYKLQKLVESYEGGRKPNMAVAGHWHQMGYFMARSVHALYPGCFQAQTEFERRKALQPQIGAVVIEATLRDDGTVHEFTPTFLRYHVPKERDWE